MTWLNPAALVGLLALAVPLLVHLFGRRVARRQRFPSLRLLLDSRPSPRTRSRPSDLVLLVLRCAVLAAAVMALAQPRWSSRDQLRDASVPARLILVDTSASVRRLTSDGGSALDRARSMAQQMLDSARDGMIVETDRPGAHVAGAASWLARRSGLRELVILSDFQDGALSDGALAAVPAGIGINLRRVGVSRSDSSTTVPVDVGASLRATADGAGTQASWQIAPADSLLPFTVQAAPADSADTRAMIRAVRGVVGASAVPGRRVTIEFAASPTLPPASTRLTSPWQGDLFLALLRDQVLTQALGAAGTSPACEAPGATISARDGGVVLHSCLVPGSVAAAALLGAAATALASHPAFEEHEPSTLPDETLRRWERSPTDLAPRGTEETSPNGRWFWLLAIGLLGLEQFARRIPATPASGTAPATRQDRVA